MATGTTPTEAEIRAEVIESGHDWPSGDPYSKQLEALITDWAAPLWSAAFDALEADDPRDPDGGSHVAIWRDLRPSEAIVLRQAVRDAIRRAVDRCDAIVVDELTAAGVAFAVQYPDAPRAAQAVPA